MGTDIKVAMQEMRRQAGRSARAFRKRPRIRSSRRQNRDDDRAVVRSV